MTVNKFCVNKYFVKIPLCPKTSDIISEYRQQTPTVKHSW